MHAIARFLLPRPQRRPATVPRDTTPESTTSQPGTSDFPELQTVSPRPVPAFPPPSSSAWQSIALPPGPSATAKRPASPEKSRTAQKARRLDIEARMSPEDRRIFRGRVTERDHTQFNLFLASLQEKQMNAGQAASPDTPSPPLYEILDSDDSDDDGLSTPPPRLVQLQPAIPPLTSTLAEQSVPSPYADSPSAASQDVDSSMEQDESRWDNAPGWGSDARPDDDDAPQWMEWTGNDWGSNGATWGYPASFEQAPTFDDNPDAQNIYWVVVEGVRPGVYYGYSACIAANPIHFPSDWANTEDQANGSRKRQASEPPPSPPPPIKKVKIKPVAMSPPYPAPPWNVDVEEPYALMAYREQMYIRMSYEKYGEWTPNGARCQLPGGMKKKFFELDQTKVQTQFAPPAPPPSPTATIFELD
ncbi:hypothetical protein BDZ89DRAFT_1051175 [Hymenopellis radicata]|nr:hypothetical protein BDZ89DRAFT_1051175 [Hymenopellis radicata]